MVCGTPVAAFNKGSVPEIVLHGKTGIVADSLDEMVKSVKTIGRIDSSDCRNHIKNNFSVESMAEKYSGLYQKTLSKRILCQKISL